MVSWKRLMLLALSGSLLGAPVAQGDTPSSSTGITGEDQREERFYNFDHGRQSGGGFSDPSDLIRKLQNARNLQRATEPTDTLDAALENFAWPDEHGSSPEGGQTADPVANRSSGPIHIPGDLFPETVSDSSQEQTQQPEEEQEPEEEEENEQEEENEEDETTDNSASLFTTP